jgi:hypothetical protein
MSAISERFLQPGNIVIKKQIINAKANQVVFLALLNIII